jgi:hypothetical protein
MKPLTIPLAAAMAALFACACGTARDAGETRTDRTETIRVDAAANPDDDTRAAQARIAAALYETLVPRLKRCWSRVEGEGEVEFTSTYVRKGDTWVWQKQQLAFSSLPEAQRAVADDCMRESASGTAFPLDTGEMARNATELVLTWGWPVPLPSDTSQLARMIDTGDGAPECRKSCKDCAYSKQTGKSFCAPACSGWTDCREDGTGTGCQMTRPECKTGWSGSWVGTVIALGGDPAREASCPTGRP